MTKYQHYSDTKVSARGGSVRWVDFGEIRNLDPDEAMWLAKQLASAAVEAEVQE